jgi:serine/threonine protein kinase
MPGEKRPDALVGEKIRGYRLEHLLAVGSATAVYDARTRERWLDPHVMIATVLVPEGFPARVAFMERWSQLGARLAALRHPSLFPLYGYGEHDTIPYLLLPMTSGETLAHLRKAHPRFSAEAALALIAPLAEVLEYLHEHGIIHLAMHPGNILLDERRVQLLGTGLPHLLRLSDLEGALARPYSHLTSITGSWLGNAAYLAPEVIRGEEIPDGRADVYALGVLLFDLLSGSPPFQAEDYLDTALHHLYHPLPGLHERCPDVPIALELVVNQALHRNRQQRYERPGDLVSAFAYVLNQRMHSSPILTIAEVVEHIRRLPVPGTPLTLSERSSSEGLFLSQERLPRAFLASPLSVPLAPHAAGNKQGTGLSRFLGADQREQQREVERERTPESARSRQAEARTTHSSGGRVHNKRAKTRGCGAERASPSQESSADRM